MADEQEQGEVTDVERAILALWRSYASKGRHDKAGAAPGPIVGLLLVFDGPEARHVSAIFKVDSDGGLGEALESAMAAQQACEESIRGLAQEEARRQLAQAGKATVKASSFVH